MPITLTKNDEQMLETLKRDRLAEAHARTVGEKSPYNCGAYLASRPRSLASRCDRATGPRSS